MPCHAFFQFYVAEAAPVLPALPAQRRHLPACPSTSLSYALLTQMFSQRCDLDIGRTSSGPAATAHLRQSLRAGAARSSAREPRPVTHHAHQASASQHLRLRVGFAAPPGYDPHPGIKASGGLRDPGDPGDLVAGIRRWRHRPPKRLCSWRACWTWRASGRSRSGKHRLMGRKTWDSLPPVILFPALWPPQHRHHAQPAMRLPDGAETFASLAAALAACARPRSSWWAAPRSALALPTHKLALTEVDRVDFPDADRHFSQFGSVQRLCRASLRVTHQRSRRPLLTLSTTFARKPDPCPPVATHVHGFAST